MPALTKSRLWSPRGLTEAEGTSWWPWRSRKKLRKVSRTAAAWGERDSVENCCHGHDLPMARRSLPAAAATGAAILAPGNGFAGSESDVWKEAFCFPQRPLADGRLRASLCFRWKWLSKGIPLSRRCGNTTLHTVVPSFTQRQTDIYKKIVMC